MTFDMIKLLAAKTEAEIIEYRHHLHKYPEASHDEYKTTAYIAEKLDAWHVPYEINEVGTGLIAELKGTEPGMKIAFRADIDALVMQEQNDLPFRSVNDGVMHACGHDAHTAILLGIVHVFAEHREFIKGTIVFVFQQSEEASPSGAKQIMDSGKLDDVDRIYALHVRAMLDAGIIGVSHGPAYANTDRFKITITGKGGHGAKPFECNDPIIMAAQAINAMQTIISRQIDAQDAGVLSICTIHAGTVHNVIPATVTMEGTARTYLKSVQDTIEDGMRRVLDGVTAMYGGSYTLEYKREIPTLTSDDTEVERAARVIQGLGTCKLEYLKPIMGGEDFSFFTEKIPGVYMILGAKDPNRPGTPHHNPSFMIREEVFRYGLEAMLGLYFDVTEQL